MTTIAIPHWHGRVSPVFDVATHVLLVQVDERGVAARHDVDILTEDPRLRADELAATGADVLICGAISRPLEMAVAAAGVEVICQICGDIEQVLQAYIDKRLDDATYAMPGCCGRRRGCSTTDGMHRR